MAPTEKYREIFGIMEVNVQTFLSQVSIPEADTGGGNESTGFDAGKFWTTLCTIADKLGFEANKATVMWINSPLPKPEDMHAVCGAFEIACVALLNTYHTLPSSEGATLKSFLTDGIKVVFESAVKFASCLLQSVGQTYTSPDNHPLVSHCGIVMRACESLKTMPRTNGGAVAAKLLAHANIIKDALRELEEAKNSDSFMEDFECEENWSDSDFIIMSPLLGMIKTSGALTKKTMDTVKKCDQLDTLKIDAIPNLFAKIPELVDDLALSLYPPLDWNVSKTEAWKLKDRMEEVITQLGEILGPDHKTWLDFMEKAVKHNTATVQGILIQHGMAQLQLGEGNQQEKEKGEAVKEVEEEGEGATENGVTS
eukprot:TRINITY_DN9470_c0_g1_i7.p1 TRINITY_DN9470_c0_g1~~TRINITY_DN9470_c0_g1_i7.p1  ORF type:complete len:368 (-),score=76.28 TRINITY_DN9470_c0_g1_i7:128-1231(-)